MTTVVCDGSRIASDSLVVFGEQKVSFPTNKIYKLYPPKPIIEAIESVIKEDLVENSPVVISFSGDLHLCKRVIRSFEETNQDEEFSPHSANGDDTQLMMTVKVRVENHKKKSVESEFRHYNISTEGGVLSTTEFPSVWAIGTGAEYALGAIEAGVDAREAVRIACKFDSTSSLDPTKGDPYTCNLN